MLIWILLTTSAVFTVVLTVFAKVPLVYNLRNLTLRWRTTVLTAAAFTLVIALLVVMLAFVNGMNALTQASGNPSNVLVLASGSTDEAFSNLSLDDVREIETLPQILRDNDGTPWVSRETYMFAIQAIPDAPPGRPKRRYVQIRGLADAAVAAKVHDAKLKEGTWFSQSGVPVGVAVGRGRRGTGFRPVLHPATHDRGHSRRRHRPRDRPRPLSRAARHGAQPRPARRWRHLLPRRRGRRPRAHRRLGAPAASGHQVGRRRYPQIGRNDLRLRTLGQAVAGRALFGKDAFTSLLVRAKDPETVQEFKEFLNKDYKKVSVDSHIEREYYASLTELTTQFLVATIVVTVCVSVGGVFGVMNTMFAAISQRIKDIGVLRLLGYKRRQILFSFLLESLVIALVGGTAGCLLGTLADGWTATSILSGHSGAGKFVILKLVVDAQILGVGILIALGMGLIGGLLPALAAMRLKPLEALR